MTEGVVGVSVSREVSDGIQWAFTHRKTRSGGPGITPDWVLQRFGDEVGEEILKTIKTISSQTWKIEKEINWEELDLAAGQRHVENRLLELNPGLAQPAANWIARWFSYQVK